MVPRLPQLRVGGGWAIKRAWNMVGVDLSLLLSATSSNTSLILTAEASRIISPLTPIAQPPG
jgi:phosphopantothenoylcysteine synthetase/decarboxylase